MEQADARRTWIVCAISFACLLLALAVRHFALYSPPPESDDILLVHYDLEVQHVYAVMHLEVAPEHPGHKGWCRVSQRTTVHVVSPASQGLPHLKVSLHFEGLVLDRPTVIGHSVTHLP